MVRGSVNTTLGNINSKKKKKKQPIHQKDKFYVMRTVWEYELAMTKFKKHKIKKIKSLPTVSKGRLVVIEGFFPLFFSL